MFHENFIPKIEGFQPIPNAVMIPFMEAQSAALAYGFGLNYEYGKRKIRSMSNDEFNSLSSEDITNMSNEHTHIILSQFQLQVPKVMPMQIEIFKQYVAIEKEKILQNVALTKWIVSNAPQILVEGTSSDSGSTIREDTTGQDIFAEEPQITSRRDTSAHTNSHNDILIKYDENFTLEQLVLQWVKEKEAALARSSANNVTTLTNKIKAGKQRLLQNAAMLAALQRNHQQNYGHQAVPFSKKL